MKKTTLIFTVLTLSGCSDPQWKDAITDYKCTEEQHEKAFKEAKEFLSLDDSYYANYVYGSAILRNCELREAGEL